MATVAVQATGSVKPSGTVVGARIVFEMQVMSAGHDGGMSTRTTVTMVGAMAGTMVDGARAERSAVDLTVAVAGMLDWARAERPAMDLTVAVARMLDWARSVGSVVDLTVAMAGMLDAARSVRSVVDLTVAMAGMLNAARSIRSVVDLTVAMAGMLDATRSVRSVVDLTVATVVNLRTADVAVHLRLVRPLRSPGRDGGCSGGQKNSRCEFHVLSFNKGLF